jgi:hypothetical protein
MNHFSQLDTSLHLLICSYLDFIDYRYIFVSHRWNQLLGLSKVCEELYSFEYYSTRGAVCLINRIQQSRAQIQRVKTVTLSYKSVENIQYLIGLLNVNIKVDKLKLVIPSTNSILISGQLDTITTQWLDRIMVTDIYIETPNISMLKSLTLCNLKTLKLNFNDNTIPIEDTDLHNIPFANNVQSLSINALARNFDVINSILVTFLCLNSLKINIGEYMRDILILLIPLSYNEVRIPKNIVKLEMFMDYYYRQRLTVTFDQLESIKHLGMPVKLWNEISIYQFPKLQSLKLCDLQEFELPKVLNKLTLYERLGNEPLALECLLQAEKSQIEYLKIVRNGTHEAYPDPEIWTVCERFNVKKLQIQATTLYREQLRHFWREFTTNPPQKWTVNYRTLTAADSGYKRIKVIFIRK